MGPTDKVRRRELSGASRGGPPSRHPQRDAFADCNSLYQQITDKIIAELEQSRVPWVQPWSNVKAPLGLPKNAATGRVYSVNVLIL